MAHRDGDGFIRCQCGHSHWGVHGAAGLLLVRTDLARPSVLLQLRAGWTHGGGTWALPGGARDSHEDVVTAALREAAEEVGVDHSRVEVRK
ncbi:MAG: NUDIX domain-containing protein, partial [Actinobacteria bacterium]|nr:NUDIX domain-containing protein [Actinomycetota bacterium]